MNPGLLLRALFFIILILGLIGNAGATHLRAGQITATRVDCNSLTFKITVTVFTNLGSTVLFGGDDDILDLGDGSDPDNDGKVGYLIREQPNTFPPGLPPGVGMATFTYYHTYPALSSYTISYSEPNRNGGVANMDNSIETRFYIETQITLDPFFGCNLNTPQLKVPPIDIGCTGVKWFHNPGAYDLDGDKLTYELLVPFRARNTTVLNYRSPNAPEFYQDYANGNETADGPPTFEIDPDDGTITWDAPGMKGEYNIAFLIKEWRQIRGEWVEIGYVRRDMQIIIDECENKRPDLIVPEDLCVVAGETVEATILGIDPDNHDVKIEAYSEIFDLQPVSNRATFQPNPVVYQSSVPTAELEFSWKTECANVRAQPYQVVFKITDNAPTGPDLVTFKTWFITVVGPSPEFTDVNPIQAVGSNSVTINWENYTCDNATTMQIWRRVDSLDIVIDTCVTGMPANAGYTLIEERPISEVTFTDNNDGAGLAAGAVYCYRLVAVFPLPRGGESLVSEEVCIELIADEPIITKVSIERTDPEEGEILVEWLPPYEALATFPPPYTYKLVRSTGLTPGTEQVVVQNRMQPFWTDQGLNTRDNSYSYIVVAFDAEGDSVRSFAASSVRLEAKSEVSEINLSWSANVPWSNQTGVPHKVFRVEQAEGQDISFPAQLTFLADVEVTSAGLRFTDAGPLSPSQRYCYVVETYGSYGSDDPEVLAREPLRNYSQIVCTELGDTIPPCKPINLEGIDIQNCAKAMELPCNPNQFKNHLKWDMASECDTDIAFYRIYFSKTNDGTFAPLLDENSEPVEVRGNEFIHDFNLTSYAGCYKVAAVDRSGNEGELSEMYCFDNCPYYELPNVFTPGSDDCNETFAAYRYIEYGDGVTPPCQYSVAEARLRCPRFVRQVTFNVYNRWGKEVFEYQSELGNEDRSIFIDWDGRSEDGTDLASGIYYYSAEVIFETSDPAKAKKIYKGWVHLLR